MSRSSRNPAKNQDSLAKTRRRARRGWRPELGVESLENRVLLSVTPTYSNGVLTFTDPANISDNLTLRVAAGNVDYSTDGVNYTQSEPLAVLQSITVQLGNGNDSLTVDPTLSDVLAPDNIALDDVGGAGQNTLASVAGAADPANTWDINSPGAGTLDQNITFSGMTNLLGGSGSDTFSLGAGMQNSQSAMAINGGLGLATLDYSAYTGPVTVNLATGAATDLARISNISNVTGGSGLNTITGNARDSIITAGPGDNVFTPGVGRDTFVFNADIDHGATRIYGAAAAGSATLDFSPTQNAAVTLDLSSASAQNVTPSLTLTLEPANTVTDVIGGGGLNTITANSGTDNITAGPGNNVLIEGTGDDTFTFNADVDHGSTQIIGTSADGLGTLDFSPTLNTAVTVDLSSTSAQNVTPNLSLTLSPGNTVDAFVGGQNANTITPNGGGDVLQGGSGTNTYVLNADLSLGSVAIISTEGSVDTLDFSPTQHSPVTIDLTQQNSQAVNQNLTLLLAPIGAIANVIGGGGTNTITGDGLDNVITAGPGGNVLTAGTGNDTFAFNADTALGATQIFGATGGTGVNTLDFSATRSTPITVDLSNTSSQNVTANLALTLEPGNTVDNVIGGAASNTITANSASDTITAGPGNNILTAGAGVEHVRVRCRHGRRQRRDLRCKRRCGRHPRFFDDAEHCDHR